jgi:chromosome segregation protein
VKVSYVSLCGFRGFRTPFRIQFADDATIIDGRNGVGKSSIFDAIEFALTGKLTKYGDAKSSRESVEDYVWWRGEGDAAEGRFVEVGFVDQEGEVAVRRTPLGVPDEDSLKRLTARLCDLQTAPSASVGQLCSTSIIRDELITDLSLDMGETERYSLLRDALGASDAERWIARAKSLAAACDRRSKNAEQDVAQANAELASASRRLDQLRASLTTDEIIAKATQALQSILTSNLSSDQLIGPTRAFIASSQSRLAAIDRLLAEWPNADVTRHSLPDLKSAVANAEVKRDSARRELEQFPAPINVAIVMSQAAQLSRDLLTLARIGKELGLNDGSCPLCAAGRTMEDYEAGIVQLERRAQVVDGEAAEILKRQESRARAEAVFNTANGEVERSKAVLNAAMKVIDDFDSRVASLTISAEITPESLSSLHSQLRVSIEIAGTNLRILETLRFNQPLEEASLTESAIQARLQKAQERYGRARKAEVSANALHDASRRAASETLDRRLERVLPLMAELYQRLRPHPTWDNIEYSIRGDVRRFLKLQVGDGLNPQFMFSSGQRRATGLAFLLSVNLSLAWSKWKSLLLDDPVQHIDDFRSVHLAEVLAQMVADGRQIICAVEDSALADLLGRRLPVRTDGACKRVTLSSDSAGALSVSAELTLRPLVATVLVRQEPQATG